METNERNQEYEEPAPNVSDFTGGAFANFGIALVTCLVSLFTFGIAYPFMRCWKLKWVAKHTFIDGWQQVFDGNGGQLIGKYLLWILLSIVTIGIYAIFFMPLNMVRWTTKHTHFEGETRESYFDGSIWGLFGTNLVAVIVTLITVGLGIFWAHCYKKRWYARHTNICLRGLAFDGKGMQYFGKCIVWLLLSVITLGIYLIWYAVKSRKWTTQHTHFAV